MAVKIIKLAPQLPETPKETACCNCQATLSYLKEDVKDFPTWRQPLSSRLGSPKQYIVCPNCNSGVVLGSVTFCRVT